MPKKTSQTKNIEISNTPKEKDWLEERYDGQLAVDVYQTPTHIVVQSTVAGIKPEDLDVAISNDLVTIRGVRRRENVVEDQDYFIQECYWGGFSRSIVLPVDVLSEKAEAGMKNGILTITIPKIKTAKTQVLKVKNEAD
ncbi:Hsp20/alpha crystallin family protein [Candidatus Parcubacteria bacterium]|jgi:HSP20 family protein|nr:MAG: Hsp20/alpha crystallin family protein [Candidatus Parcubacteria bacterium]